jgi:2-dehydro-3-deoxygluconokinase
MQNNDRRFDIVALGEAMVEFNQATAGQPQYLQGFGGDTSNMAIAASRLGARTAVATRLGDDEFGRMLLDLWQREGVNTEAVAVDGGAPTGVYFVNHGPTGHVFSYLRAGSAASRMRVEDLPLDTIRSSSYLQASGISLAISASASDSVLAAFDAARDNGVKVALDSNLRLKLWPLARARAIIGAAIAMADYFFPSLEDAQVLAGVSDHHAIIDWAHRLGARTVLLKLGAEGVIVSDGTRRDTIEGFKVASVDATGAGDCFCGAFLARRVAGDSAWDAARYANAAAALSTTGFGAVAPLPTPAAVAKLLATG